ncbi:MAG: phage tail sheath subtilisin-like domain-containing protein, partial [Saprospiraceae bacterium]|nr:phage tail sheath subtilisin-like domain-containing protein [Saprospiraceae bacterium]
MPNNIPKVYIEEHSTIPPTVAGVETGVPAFVGYTEKHATAAGVSLLNKPTKIESMHEYVQCFGEAQPENKSIRVLIQDVVKKILVDPSKEALISRTIQAQFDAAKRSKFNLYYALQWYFINGGGSCYIVSVGTTPANGTGKPMKSRLLKGLKALEQEDEPTILVIPEALNSGYAAEIYQAALAQAAKLRDRMVIIDVKQSSGVEDDLSAFRSSLQDNLMYGAAYYPHLDTLIQFQYQDHAIRIEHKKQEQAGVSKRGEFDRKTLKTITDHGVQSAIKAQIDQLPLQLPPSPAMAGIWARVDAARGVWKAPANESVASVIRLGILIDDNTAATMNIDAIGGKSVNAIRSFTGRGILVWGAR